MRRLSFLIALVAFASSSAACQTPTPVPAEPERVASSRPERVPAPPAPFSVGTPVEILWQGGWYDGHVLEAAADSFKVGYDGYGDIWDEWVGLDRLRPHEEAEAPPAPAPAEPAPPPPAPAAPSASDVASAEQAAAPPLGKYVCRQYMTTIAYVTLQPGGTYEIAGVTGRYRHDAATGEVVWDGGSFDEWGWAARYEHVRRPEGDGRPDEHILRVVSEGDGLRLDCFKMAE